MAYERDRSRVDAAMRKSGVCVVMNKSHIEKPDHMVTTMKAVYEAALDWLQAGAPVADEEDQARALPAQAHVHRPARRAGLQGVVQHVAQGPP